MAEVVRSMDPSQRKRGSVQDEVLAQLRRGLMAGALIPGQVISIRKLASSLGTSPMPVRDALSQLLASNALEELPNRSVRVPILSRKRLEELFAVREVVEGMAARRACEQATPQLIDELKKINKELIYAIGNRAFQLSLDANQRFHFTLYRAAASEVLMPIIESLWLQCGPTLYFSLVVPDAPWTAAEHTKTIAALRKRDADLVSAALARDIQLTGGHLLRNRQEVGLQGPLSFARLGLDVRL